MLVILERPCEYYADCFNLAGLDGFPLNDGHLDSGRGRHYSMVRTSIFLRQRYDDEFSQRVVEFKLVLYLSFFALICLDGRNLIQNKAI